MSRAEYFNLAIRAPARLAMMRADYTAHSTKYPHCPQSAKPANWRAVRSWGFHNWEGAFGTLDAGMQGKTPIWYTHAGPEFRDERRADEIIRSLPRGWYTDCEGSATAIGIVARLSHGRFIAGYLWTSNDERVYYPDVFIDEKDAAHAADSHAEVFADNARDDSERFNAMRDAENDLETAVSDLADSRALRRMGRRNTADVSRAIAGVRKARESLTGATQAYERG